MWRPEINASQFLSTLFIIIYVYGCHVHAVVDHVQKREFDPLELELHVVVIRPVRVLGTECLSYERAVSTANHWASSLVPPTLFLEIGSVNEPDLSDSI